MLLPCDSTQTYLRRSLGIDIIFTVLSGLFQWRRFVWITPFLVVLRLTWFKVCFIFQIVETLSTNDWFSRFLSATVVVAFIALEGNNSWAVKIHLQHFNILIRIHTFSRRFQFYMKRHHTLAKHSQFDSRECKCIPNRGNNINFSANYVLTNILEEPEFVSFMIHPIEKLTG